MLRLISLKSIVRYLLLGSVVSLLLCIAASAQVSFVQVTDPHLYDDGQEAAENKRALIECVTKIDNMMAAGADYKFGVVTGDIGIEKLVKPLIDQREHAVSPEEIDRINRTIDNRITGAAMEVANVLAPSKISVWLFLPGNNDLIDEKTDTINYYREFIKQLGNALPGKKVIDLCPTDDPHSGVYSWNDSFFFIGFNNASFKNNNEAARISSGTNTAEIVAAANSSNAPKLATTKTSDEQLKYVQQVVDRISQAGDHPAYIFYHIPEIDDPHPILNSDLSLLNDRKLSLSNRYALSSWFVDGRVRQLWDRVVADSKVKGLFAGHFHDWRRDTYQDYHWMVTPYYLGGSLSKLYICPPIAVKRQGDQAAQARGFQAVSIDGTGKVSINVFWYDAARRSFNNQDERQLALGEMYEDNYQLSEAEAAYTKALDSESAPIRQKAFESLRRVVGKRNSFKQRYFTSPVASLMERGAAFVFTALPAALIILVVWWLAGKYGKKTGKGKVEIVPFTDSTKEKLGENFTKIFEFVLGIMHLHYKARGPIRGLANLPVLARSQQADIAEFVESAAPAGIGKALAWATKRLHQPEYSVYGSVQTDGAALTVLVILERTGETLGSWSESTAMPTGGGPSLLEVEEGLAYEVLIFLKGHMNQ
jgi:hypothetical protein